MARFECIHYPGARKVIKRLTNKTFADYVIFQNSGVEATEVAIKIRKYFYQRYAKKINFVFK